MPQTNLALITGAFQRIGTVDETEAPSAAQAQNGLNILNGYLATIAVDGIKLGWFPQTDLAAIAPLRDSAEFDVATMLCKQLAIAYGVDLTAKVELKEEIVQAERRLTKRSLKYFESDLTELSRPQGSPWGGFGWF